jgi:hypothetical protein
MNSPLTLNRGMRMNSPLTLNWGLTTNCGFSLNLMSTSYLRVSILRQFFVNSPTHGHAQRYIGMQHIGMRETRVGS